jgi:hypothetical protein
MSGSKADRVCDWPTVIGIKVSSDLHSVRGAGYTKRLGYLRKVKGATSKTFLELLTSFEGW